MTVTDVRKILNDTEVIDSAYVVALRMTGTKPVIERIGKQLEVDYVRLRFNTANHHVFCEVKAAELDDARRRTRRNRSLEYRDPKLFPDWMNALVDVHMPKDFRQNRRPSTVWVDGTDWSMR